MIDKEYDDNEQDTSEMKSDEFTLTNVLAFTSRSKAKAKPRRRTSAGSSTRTAPIGERTWADIEPEDYSPIACPVSAQLSTLLRHGRLLREDDGAIEFWRLKADLRNKFEHSQHGSDEMWKGKMAGGGALQGHSGPNSIDPSLRDNVQIPYKFFEYIYKIGCANQFTLHHEFGIDTRTKLEQKTDGILHGFWILWTRNTIRTTLTWPLHVVHGTSRTRGQDTKTRCVGSFFQLCQRKGLKFYQTKSNAIILHDTLPAYCVPKVVVMESGEIINEKGFVSLRPPPTI